MKGTRERGEGTLAPDHARLVPVTDFSVSVCSTLETCSQANGEQTGLTIKNILNLH